MVDFSSNSMLIFTACGPEFLSNAMRIGSNDTNLRFKGSILRFCGPTKPMLMDFESAAPFWDFFKSALLFSPWSETNADFFD